MNRKTQKLAMLSLLTAAAVIFGYVEYLVPISFGYPGIKLGLANISILFILERFSVPEAFLVSFIRIFIIGFTLNPQTIWYASAGAFLSITVMSVLRHKTRASVYAVSMAGGLSHNFGQLMAAIFLMRLRGARIVGFLMFQGPIMVISGILTGYLIGWLTVETLRRIP